ncbi:MAG: alpha-D-glucose phosphate-specific phosphoglucomutase, partial [Prochlorococcus sp.]
DAPAISLEIQGHHTIASMGVEVIDGVDEYGELMQKLFDFERISDLIRVDFPVVFDAMHAVTGPYAKRLLEGLLGAPTGTVRNGVPLEDFGGGNPDP